MTNQQLLAAGPTRAAAATTLVAARVALLVAALALLSQVAVPIPFTPVPLTLGSMAALGIAALFPRRGGLAAVVAYLVLGGLGVPLFAGWQAGVTFASFGYVLGYVAGAALVVSYLNGATKRSLSKDVTVAVGATALVYVFGTSWLVALTGMSWASALAVGVVPFLVGDALKTAALVGILRFRAGSQQARM